MRSFTSTLISSNHSLIVLQLTLHRIRSNLFGGKKKYFKFSQASAKNITKSFSSRFPAIGAKALHLHELYDIHKKRICTQCWQNAQILHFSIMARTVNTKKCSRHLHNVVYTHNFFSGCIHREKVKKSFYVCLWEA